MSALNTDLYQLTMAAGYVAANKQNDIATFELMVRRLPEGRNFLVAAGLQQAVEYLQSLRFEPAEIEYLRSLEQFRHAPPAFFDILRDLRFTGDVFALPEGTPFFAGEPVLYVRAPLIQAQLVETYLLSTIAFQTSVASKAARCVLASGGRPVSEFGSRRAHSPAAAVWAARAAFVGGCVGTSNTQAGMLFSIPVFGTAAHSWTMAFASEEESFRALQELLGDATVFLIDTYDTVQGARHAVEVGRPSWGVRLDSGDLLSLSKQVRSLLDAAGRRDARIMATNDLDEHRIGALLLDGAPIDAFGVGTQLATSADAPALSAVYKMVAIQSGDAVRYTAKYSPDKSTLPGAKQILRLPDNDLLVLTEECGTGEPMLRPVMVNGRLLEPLPTLETSRARTSESVARLPPDLLSLDGHVDYPVRVSKRLRELAGSLQQDHSH